MEEKVLISVLAAICLLVASAQADPVVKTNAQRELEAKFPYYFAGTNKFGQSVYLVEYNKWDHESALQEGTSAELLLDEFYNNYFNTLIQDGLSSDNGSILISDQKGFDLSQMETPTVSRFLMKQILKFEEMNPGNGIKQVYLVNSHQGYMDLMNAIKPSLKKNGGLINLITENVSEWPSEVLSSLNMDAKPLNGLSGLSPLQLLLKEEFPHELRTKFPYYLSGYIADGSPIFIMPLGKYYYKSVIEKGPESAEQLSRLMSQMLLRLQVTSVRAPGGRGAILIIDAKGLSVEQFESPAVQNRLFSDLTVMNKINSEPGLHKIYVIHAPPTMSRYPNFHEDLLHLVNTSNKFHVFHEGEDFRSALREVVKTPIHEEYGGTSDYSPLVTY